jgi:hypothetical protein
LSPDVRMEPCHSDVHPVVYRAPVGPCRCQCHHPEVHHCSHFNPLSEPTCLVVARPGVSSFWRLGHRASRHPGREGVTTLCPPRATAAATRLPACPPEPAALVTGRVFGKAPHEWWPAVAPSTQRCLARGWSLRLLDQSRDTLMHADCHAFRHDEPQHPGITLARVQTCATAI